MFLSIRSGIYFFHVFHKTHVRLITRRNMVFISLLTKTTSLVLFVGEEFDVFLFYSHFLVKPCFL